MSDGGMSPSQFQILREDFRGMRQEFNLRFDNLVTRDAFRDERSRVDGITAGLGREIGEVKRDLDAEAQARVTGQSDSLKAQIAEKNEREKLRRATQWQWVFLAVSLIGGPIIGAFIASTLTAIGAGAGTP